MSSADPPSTPPTPDIENSTIPPTDNLLPGNSVQCDDDTPPMDEVQMLVSSKHLMSASTVFKAMLRAGAFQEGQTLNSTGRVSIPLPDDNPDAMKVLLDILHHRNRQVPKTVTLSLMTHLTILVDKYQMVEVLEAYQPIWLADGA
jgi:hypothetical protein